MRNILPPELSKIQGFIKKCQSYIASLKKNVLETIYIGKIYHKMYVHKAFILRLKLSETFPRYYYRKVSSERNLFSNTMNLLSTF